MTATRSTQPIRVSLAAAWIALAMLASSAMAQDATTQPATTQPTTVATAPATTQPSTAEATTGPATTGPTATGPVATGPTATGPATTEPVAFLPTSNPSTRPASDAPVTMNFQDASVDSVLEYLADVGHLTVLRDVKIEGRINVISPHPVPVAEAIAQLDSVLKTKGYAAVRTGQILKIVTIEQAKKELIPVQVGNDPEKITPSDRIITQVIPLKHVEAAKLKTDLSSLIPSSVDVAANVSSNTLIVTGNEAVIRRMVEVIHAIDGNVMGVAQVRVFALKYASASNAAKLIMDLFKTDQANQQQGGGQGRFQAIVYGGQPAGDDTSGIKPVKVTASADDRTNTLVVSASADVLKVIEGIVNELEKNHAEDQVVYTYRLKNGTAKNMEAVLNSTFGTSSGSTSTGSNTNTRTSTGTTSAFGSRTGSGSGSGSRGLSANTNTGGSSGRTTGGNTSTPSRGTSSGRGTTGAPPAGSTDLTGQVFVVADPDTNSLLVTTSSNNWPRVKTIIDDLDRAVPQVLIKVLIAEVTHDDSLDLGVEFSGLNLGAKGTDIKVGTDFNVAAQKTGFTFALNEDNVTAAIRAIANTSKLDVLSRPYILTGDNQQASIMIGQEVPFITQSQTLDTGQTINTIEYDDIGIMLTVTPHINPQGLVTLDVAPEISTLTGQTVPISSTVSAPVFAKRSAQSRVAIRDGQTIVIGGLMEDRNTSTVDKVPILGDIPVLGILFSRTITKKTKTELLIFLTPHVAKMPEQLEGMADQEKANLKVIPKSIDPKSFEEHLKGLKIGAATQPAWAQPEDTPADTQPADDGVSTTQPAGDPSNGKNH